MSKHSDEIIWAQTPDDGFTTALWLYVTRRRAEIACTTWHGQTFFHPGPGPYPREWMASYCPLRDAPTADSAA